MKKLLTFLLPCLLVACSSFDEVNIVNELVPMRITTSGIEDMDTRATLVTDANIASVFPTMVVMTNDWSVDVPTASLVKATEDKPYEIAKQWGTSASTFVSMPKYSTNYQELKAETFTNVTIGDGFVTFRPTCINAFNDVVVAVDKKYKEGVKLKYHHIYCTVNLIYRDLNTAHTISDIKVHGALQGTCKVTKDTTEWIAGDGQAMNPWPAGGASQAYSANQDLGITKIMCIPLVKPTISLKIDGKELRHTVTCNPAPGKIINVKIDDQLKFTEEENAEVDNQIKITPNGSTYDMELTPFIRSKEIKSTVADTVKVTKHLPMDYILVLDYSSSMTSSYSDSKLSSYQAATVTKYTYNDWKSNKTKYSATLNGKSYTITCTDTKNSNNVGYTSDNIHWAYITVGSDRYYVTLDGGLHKSTNTNPTSSNFPVSVDGQIIYPSVGGYHYLFGTVAFASKKVNNRMVALQAAVSAFVDQIKDDAKTNGIVHRVCIIDFQDPKFPSYTNKQSGRATYINKTSPNYLRQCYALQYDKSTNNNAYYDNKSTTGVLFPFRPIDEMSANSIKAAVSLPCTAGSTAIDYGMYLASLELPYCRSTAEKCVVVFTDGKATHATGAILSDCVISGYNSANQKMSDTDVENGAKKYSQVCKNAKATVWAVSVFAGKDKPSSTFMSDLATDASHYIDASSGSLSEAFKTISSDVVTTEEITVDYPALPLGKDSYVELRFSDLFVFDSNSRPTITLPSGCTSTWISDKTVRISGFDYATNFGEAKKPTFMITGLKKNPNAGTNNGCAFLPGSGLYAADGTLIEDYHGYTL